MLTWALACFLGAVVSAVLGFGGIFDTARFAFFVFLIGFVVFVVAGVVLPPKKVRR
jgi:uncharacterized membrane protein YtjA (UPF0391 family)